MGLDLWIGDPEDNGEHCARWSYGGFSHFRNMLAKAEGINLEEMQGYSGSIPWKTRSTKLCSLFNHSDCYGVLNWRQCKTVFARLREICAGWSNPEDDFDKTMGLKLAAGMEECVKRKLSLYFR